MLAYLLLRLFRQSPLDGRDPVSQTEGNALSLRTNADVSSEFPIIVLLLFYGDVDQGILTKHTDIGKSRKIS